MDSVKIGKLIARTRKAKGVSQTELGEKIGYKQNMISKIESGGLAMGIQIDDLAKISEALGEPELLVAYCKGCPARPYAVPGAAPDPDQALAELRSSLANVMNVAGELTRKLGAPGFEESPDLAEGLAKISAIQRGIEALGHGLGFAGCAGCGA